MNQKTAENDNKTLGELLVLHADDVINRRVSGPLNCRHHRVVRLI